MDYDLRDMCYFVRVVDEGSITRAAEKLYISQPALSRKLSELENRLGLRLLDRTTRKLSLTDAGRAFERYARRVLDDCEALSQEIEAVRRGSHGMLRLGYGSNGQFDYAMRITASMRREYPGIQISTEAGDMLEPLYTGRVDAALLMACEVRGHDWMDKLPMERAGLSVFFSKDDPLASADGAVSISQIRGRRFVLPQRHNLSQMVRCTTLFDQIRSFLIAQGIADRSIDFAKGPQAFSVCVASGQVVGIMPDSSRVIAGDLVLCRPLLECRDGYEVVLAWRRLEEERPSIQALRSIARRQQMT